MKGRRLKYSQAELDWIEANAALPRKELFARFFAKFGRPDVTVDNIKALCTRRGWKTGRTGRYEPGSVPMNKGKKCPPGQSGNHPNARRTQFKKGRLPHNTRHAGHERISKDGYVEISIEETNPYTGYERRYVLKHRWLWEQEHGPVPEGMCLKCLDGDRTNTNPANWKAIPRALLPRLDGRFGRGYENAEPELRPTILAVAEIEQKVIDTRKAKK